jgi:hypothetical protein
MNLRARAVCHATEKMNLSPGVDARIRARAVAVCAVRPRLAGRAATSHLEDGEQPHEICVRAVGAKNCGEWIRSWPTSARGSERRRRERGGVIGEPTFFRTPD